MKQHLWIPGPMPGMNEIVGAAKGAGGVGKHYAKMKELWTMHVWAHAKHERIKPYVVRVRIDFLWLEANRRRDPDNIATARKFVMDGLVLAGVLADDRWKQVAGWTDDFGVATFPGVKLAIQPAD